MDRIAKALIITSCFLSSFAHAMDKNKYFYAAIDAGIFQGDFNNSYRDQTDIIQQNISQAAFQHSYTVGGSFGYSEALNPNYFLGGELSLHFEGQKASVESGASSTAFSDGMQIQYHADVSVVPGMQLSHTILSYLKLGVSLAAIQDNLNSPAGYAPIMNSYSSRKNALGLAAGVGVAKNISENTALFLEANYHDYGTVNFQSFQNFSATYSHSAHVYSYDFVMGVAFRIFS